MLLPGATAFDRLNTGSVQGAEPQAPGDLGVTRRDAGECNERSKASHKGYVKIVLKSCKLRTLNVSVHLDGFCQLVEAETLIECTDSLSWPFPASKQPIPYL